MKTHHSSKSNLTKPVLKQPLRLLVQMEMEYDVSKLYSSFIILVLIFKEKNNGDGLLWPKVRLGSGNEIRGGNPLQGEGWVQ